MQYTVFWHKAPAIQAQRGKKHFKKTDVDTDASFSDGTILVSLCIVKKLERVRLFQVVSECYALAEVT